MISAVVKNVCASALSWPQHNLYTFLSVSDFIVAACTVPHSVCPDITSPAEIPVRRAAIFPPLP